MKPLYGKRAELMFLFVSGLVISLGIVFLGMASGAFGLSYLGFVVFAVVVDQDRLARKRNGFK